MEKRKIKVFITKYALTDGIKEATVTECGDNMVTDDSMTYPACYHKEGRDWHLTKESAVARANKMRDDKIKSIAKQSARIAALRF